MLEDRASGRGRFGHIGRDLCSSVREIEDEGIPTLCKPTPQTPEKSKDELAVARAARWQSRLGCWEDDRRFDRPVWLMLLTQIDEDRRSGEYFPIALPCSSVALVLCMLSLLVLRGMIEPSLEMMAGALFELIALARVHEYTSVPGHVFSPKELILSWSIEVLGDVLTVASL